MDAAACAYEEARSSFGAKGVLTGNPVRGGFAALPEKPHRPPLTLLAFGGSQGSRVLNRALVAALPKLPGPDALRIVHQTGRRCSAEVEAAYARRRPPGGGASRSSTTWSGASPTPTSCSRASGATTCAELAVAGKAARARAVRGRRRRPPDDERARPRGGGRGARCSRRASSRGDVAGPGDQRRSSSTRTRLTAMEQAARAPRPPRRRRPRGRPPGRPEAACLERVQHDPLRRHRRLRHERHRRGAAQPRLHGLRLRPERSDDDATGWPRSARAFPQGHAAAQRGGRPRGGDLDRGARATTPRSPRRAGSAIPVIPRAEMLAELMRLKYGVAVAGSHGKTTTTSMVATVLDDGGLDPTVSSAAGSTCSARARGSARATTWWRGRRVRPLVPEALADARRRHQHRPRAPRHLPATSPTCRRLRRLRQQGALLRRGRALPRRRAACRTILPRVERRVRHLRPLAAGRRLGARRAARGLTGSRFTATRARRAARRRSRCAVPGAHNVLNSLAAMAVGLDLDVPSTSRSGPAPPSRGVDRRFQVRGEAGGVTRDRRLRPPPDRDPGHPRGAAPTGRGRRTVVLFQPHRYTRTQPCWDDFCRAFHHADVAAADGHLPGRRGAASRASPPRRWPEASRARGHRGVRYAGDLKRGHRAALQRGEGGRRRADPGRRHVWTAGEEL